jgi:hypothetical protein
MLFRYTETKINPGDLMHTNKKAKAYSPFINRNNEFIKEEEITETLY